MGKKRDSGGCSPDVTRDRRQCSHLVIITGRPAPNSWVSSPGSKVNTGEQRRPSRDSVLRPTEPLSGFLGAPPPAEKKEALVQGAEELLSLSWGGPFPAPAAPPSLRGSCVLHPHPHPRPSSFLSPPPSFLHHRVTPGPDTPCSGSGLEPVRNQSAPLLRSRSSPSGA